MCEPTPYFPTPPPLPYCSTGSSFSDMYSLSSSPSYNTKVLDADRGERDLARSLKDSIRLTRDARYTIMECIRRPAVFLLWFYAGCIVFLLITMLYKNGGFKWLF